MDLKSYLRWDPEVSLLNEAYNNSLRSVNRKKGNWPKDIRDTFLFAHASMPNHLYEQTLLWIYSQKLVCRNIVLEHGTNYLPIRNAIDYSPWPNSNPEYISQWEVTVSDLDGFVPSRAYKKQNDSPQELARQAYCIGITGHEYELLLPKFVLLYAEINNDGSIRSKTLQPMYNLATKLNVPICNIYPVGSKYPE